MVNQVATRLLNASLLTTQIQTTHRLLHKAGGLPESAGQRWAIHSATRITELIDLVDFCIGTVTALVRTPNTTLIFGSEISLGPVLAFNPKQVVYWPSPNQLTGFDESSPYCPEYNKKQILKGEWLNTLSTALCQTIHPSPCASIIHNIDTFNSSVDTTSKP